jgi:hypothetical protein
MGSLGPIHLIAGLLVIIIVAAMSGFSLARTNKRRARVSFVVGFVCGLRRRRHWLTVFRTARRWLDVAPTRRRGWARGR